MSGLTVTQQATYKEQLISAFAREIENVEVDPTVPVERAAKQAADAVPAKHPLDQEIGPFYSQSRAAAELQVQRQAIQDRIKRHTIIVCETSDGQRIVPTFQIRNNTIDKSYVRVNQILSAAGADGWTVAQWLSAKNDSLGGLTPRQWVAQGKDPNPIIESAEQTAERWSR